MTDKILYRVLCDEYEEVARIFFEIKETGEQIEGSHQIQKWINNVFNENEQLKSRVEYLERKIDRERTSYQKQHEKWEEEIQKENEQLKKENKKLNCIIKQLEEKYEDKSFSLAYDMGECE